MRGVCGAGCRDGAARGGDREHAAGARIEAPAGDDGRRGAPTCRPFSAPCPRPTRAEECVFCLHGRRMRCRTAYRMVRRRAGRRCSAATPPSTSAAEAWCARSSASTRLRSRLTVLAMAVAQEDVDEIADPEFFHPNGARKTQRKLGWRACLGGGAWEGIGLGVGRGEGVSEVMRALLDNVF